MANIVELKDVVVMVSKLVSAGVESMKDGKLSFDDAALLFKVVPAIGPAISGIGQVPAELKDLSSEEVAELAAVVGVELAIDSEKAKKVIAASFKVLGSGIELIGAIKS